MHNGFLFWCVLAVVAAVMACGCHHSDSAIDSDYVYAPSAIPFVEQADFPDAIYDAEPFEVILHLSSAQNPEYLRGAGWVNPLWSRSFRFLRDPMPLSAEGPIRIETWFSCFLPDQVRVFPDEPYCETTAFTLSLPAGDWVLQVSSADSPERGGMKDKVMVIPWFDPPDNSHVVYKEYPFTVLPNEYSCHAVGQARPTATYNQIAARIITTRDTTIERQLWQQFPQYALAGLVDFDAALTGW